MLKVFYDTSSNTRINQIVDASKLVYDTNVGEVNEETGTVTLNSFNPTALPTGQATIDVTVKPASSDVSPTRNELLTINTSTASITGEIDTMATGGVTAGINYTTVRN
jgi:predicted P-loop ATPase/GTPase